jgi:hypothetical protein
MAKIIDLEQHRKKKVVYEVDEERVLTGTDVEK